MLNFILSWSYLGFIWGGGVEEFFCDIYQFLLPYAYLDTEMVCQMFYELKP